MAIKKAETELEKVKRLRSRVKSLIQKFKIVKQETDKALEEAEADDLLKNI